MTGEGRQEDDKALIAHWGAIGKDFAQARGQRSLRAVAKAAGISEGYLRQIEHGYESKRGHKLPINPSARVLRSVATVLRLDPAPILQRAGKEGEDEGSDELSVMSPSQIISALHRLLDELASWLPEPDES